MCVSLFIIFGTKGTSVISNTQTVFRVKLALKNDAYWEKCKFFDQPIRNECRPCDFENNSIGNR